MSPSAAGGKSEEWFEAFFDACESLGCRIDYLATHDYHGEADKVMNRLEDLYNRSILHLMILKYLCVPKYRYGKKVWLTEFAKCCTHDENEIIEFVKVLITMALI